MTNNYCWATKRSLMDNTMLGTYGVSDKIGITNWIENLDDDKVKVLSECLMNSEGEEKQILEAWYSNDSAEKNTSHVINEYTWSEKRSDVLMEADDGPKHVDIVKVVKYGSITAAALFMIKLQADNPDEAQRQWTNLKRWSLSVYEQVASVTRTLSAGKVNPPSVIKTQKALQKMSDKQRELSDKIKGGKVKANTITSKRKEIKRLAKKVGNAWNQDLKKSKEGFKSVLKKSGGLLGGLIGITGLGIVLWQLYKNLLSPAAKACRGKKGTEHTACILKYKITACDIIINKYQEALGSCKDHKNPER